MMLYLTHEDVVRIEQVKAILDREFYKHHTCTGLAGVVGTNANKLKLTFKAHTTQNIYEYLTTVRIAKAKDLLENTALSIDIVARRVGLDKSNLNKQFKRLMGTTPIAWKRMQQKGWVLYWGKK